MSDNPEDTVMALTHCKRRWSGSANASSDGRLAAALERLEGEIRDRRRL